MNTVGYDLATLGNHEFDYGMEQLSILMEKANAKYKDKILQVKGIVKSVVHPLERNEKREELEEKNDFKEV